MHSDYKMTLKEKLLGWDLARIKLVNGGEVMEIEHSFKNLECSFGRFSIMLFLH